MPPGPRACETCGRVTSETLGCPDHPGAPLIDTADPEEADWAASLRGVRRERSLRGIGIAATITALGTIGTLLMTGAVETSTKGFLLAALLVGSLGLVAARIGVDAWRALTGRDTTPDGHALRRATAIRSTVGATGSLLAWLGFEGVLELLVSGVSGLEGADWVLLALGPVGLALIATATNRRFPGTREPAEAPPAATEPVPKGQTEPRPAPRKESGAAHSRKPGPTRAAAPTQRDTH